MGVSGHLRQHGAVAETHAGGDFHARRDLVLRPAGQSHSPVQFRPRRGRRRHRAHSRSFCRCGEVDLLRQRQVLHLPRHRAVSDDAALSGPERYRHQWRRTPRGQVDAGVSGGSAVSAGGLPGKGVWQHHATGVEASTRPLRPANRNADRLSAEPGRRTGSDGHCAAHRYCRGRFGHRQGATGRPGGRSIGLCGRAAVQQVPPRRRRRGSAGGRPRPDGDRCPQHIGLHGGVDPRSQRQDRSGLRIDDAQPGQRRAAHGKARQGRGRRSGAAAGHGGGSRGRRLGMGRGGRGGSGGSGGG